MKHPSIYHTQPEKQTLLHSGTKTATNKNLHTTHRSTIVFDINQPTLNRNQQFINYQNYPK
jgi:hypothetical protein